MSEAAWQEAGRLLARRPLSEAELRQALVRRGHPHEAVEQTLERLRAQGWLDDRQLALDFVVAGASRRGHGRERILAALERRGVPRALAESAWCEAAEAGTIDPEGALRNELERRLGGRVPLDERAVRRVYNALLRAGFDENDIRRLLERHPGRSCPSDPGDPPDDVP